GGPNNLTQQAQPKSNPPNKHCPNIYHQLTKRLPRGDLDKYTHTPNKQQIPRKRRFLCSSWGGFLDVGKST
ncbi:hypothetical protein, partial [Corynebacterium aurimucosum]|uniref:hypothetical protein n=1 Tax=Corynebacterium aurimucosum TaxID=169292 RepID=UPI00195532E6